MRNAIVAIVAVLVIFAFANVAEAGSYNVTKTQSGYSFTFFKVASANGKSITGSVEVVTSANISRENLHYVYGAITHYFVEKLNASSNEITRIGQTGRIVKAVFKAALNLNVAVTNNKLYL